MPALIDWIPAGAVQVWAESRYYFCGRLSWRLGRFAKISSTHKTCKYLLPFNESCLIWCKAMEICNKNLYHNLSHCSRKKLWDSYLTNALQAPRWFIKRLSPWAGFSHSPMFNDSANPTVRRTQATVSRKQGAKGPLKLADYKPKAENFSHLQLGSKSSKSCEAGLQNTVCSIGGAFFRIIWVMSI